MATPIEHARAALNALTPNELATIRDEASQLLALYEKDGVLTGRGCLEIKAIRYQVGDDIQYGHYAYVRRGHVNAQGKVTIKTVGYYGTAGVEAINIGLADGLIEAHNQGGEDAGDGFLLDHGLTPPRRRGLGKPPASAPTHPLGDDSLTAAQLQDNLLFHYFHAHCPVAAQDLFTALRNYERDRDDYEWAEKNRLRFRLRNEEIERRRITGARKNRPQPPRRVRRRK
jgi:hypothetical protein